MQALKNGSSKFVGLGKFWADLKILEALLTGLQVKFSYISVSNFETGVLQS